MKASTTTLISVAFGLVIGDLTMDKLLIPLGIMDEVKQISTGLIILMFVTMLTYKIIKYRKLNVKKE